MQRNHIIISISVFVVSIIVYFIPMLNNGIGGILFLNFGFQILYLWTSRFAIWIINRLKKKPEKMERAITTYGAMASIILVMGILSFASSIYRSILLEEFENLAFAIIPLGFVFGGAELKNRLAKIY